MNEQVSVFIIDDEEQVRNALALLMKSVGLDVECYSSGQEYLEQFDKTKRGCIILDVRMPGISGLDLQEKLNQEKISPPVIVMTGHGDIPMSVRAVKAGAVHFIEKPFNNQIMLDCVYRAIKLDSLQRNEFENLTYIEQCYKKLTSREKEILNYVIIGKRNKEIAHEVDITQSTVEAHRAKVMDKMCAKTLSDLMRMAISLKLDG
ncbi:MAG: response regulator [Gammaproteobacteria bacterium]|nr:response regulator [Gammaproteobacteria bacterium]